MDRPRVDLALGDRVRLCRRGRFGGVMTVQHGQSRSVTYSIKRSSENGLRPLLAESGHAGTPRRLGTVIGVALV